MFEIEMLPAREGDCLWIRYGQRTSPKQILIDGGRAATFKDIKARLSALPPKQRTFELLIITHVDRDHIEGVLSLMTDKALNLTFKDIWFNGFDHLNQVKIETFGAVQGEKLSAALTDRKRPWNKAWKRRSVCLTTKKLPTKRLAGGMRLTLLSPDRVKLSELIPVWKAECKKAGLIAGIGSKPADARGGWESFGAIDIERLAASAFKDDTTEANGSSIAVLAQYGGKRALLTGDAHTDRLCASIRTLENSGRLKLDAFKVSHHGSDHNLSQELLSLIDCPRFMISTNGSYFGHPTPSAIARLVKFAGRGATLHFNYRTKHTKVWDNAGWKARYGYSTVYPEKKHAGTLVVSL